MYDHSSGIADLYAPSFLTFEVTNALWRAIKLKRLSQEDGQLALVTLEDLQLRLCELNWKEAAEVLDVACDLEVAIYDAAYVCLSDRMKVPLITSDIKLYEKAKNQSSVIHLKDYE